MMALALFAFTAKTQTKSVYFSENFDGATFPEGWEALSVASQWTINASGTAYAGGEPNELSYTYLPAASMGQKARFASPVIETTGMTALELNFLYRIQSMQGNPVTWGIETSSDNGETWTEAWSEEFSEIVIQNFEFSETISTDDVGSDNFRFCIFIYSTDNNPMTKMFYLDNFLLTGSVELDGNLAAIDTPRKLRAKKNEIGFILSNTGTTTINSVVAKYTIEGFEPVTETFSDLEIVSNDKLSFTFAETVFFTPGAYNVEVEILTVNGEADAVSENNTMSKEVEVAFSGTQGSVSIDHFTSSSCVPCVVPNQNMKALLDAHPGKFNVSKNQMNIPMSDPYFNNDGDIRRNYYEPNMGVPRIYFNGEVTQSYLSEIFEDVFLSYYNDMAFVDIAGSWSLNGSTIIIDADVISYTDISDAVIHVAVNEKMTTGNATTNGETEFYHVMMKMLPDGNGTSFDFEAGESTSVHFEYDMSDTFVEEYDDLEVNVFVQSHSTKRVYNGRFLTPDVAHPTAPANLKLTKENDLSFTASWNAPEANPTGYDLYLNGELIEEGYTGTSYTVNVETNNNIEIFDVAANYSSGKRDDIHSIKMMAFIDLKLVGIESQRIGKDDVKVYPNPATDRLTISFPAADGFCATLYNIAGQQVLEKNFRESENEIDVNRLPRGIYLLKLISTNGATATQKVEIR
ncbi:MAG: T9SS type A sorting domain-containing protein [Bacteroidales bacterium]|nr:T9SS type A sorting domain-containing protein [Bacteroidales bacterium]